MWKFKHKLSKTIYYVTKEKSANLLLSKRDWECLERPSDPVESPTIAVDAPQVEDGTTEGEAVETEPVNRFIDREKADAIIETVQKRNYKKRK